MVPDRETEVRLLETAYDEAWRAGDVPALVACFTPDAVIVSPRGEVARGHDDIGRLLGDFLATEASESGHHSEVVRVEFVTHDVAVVDGEARLTTLTHGSGEPLVHGFTDVLVRDHGRWAIAHVRAYERRRSRA